MKQVLQELGRGETVVAEVPCPRVQAGSLLIRSATSLVSAGTERMLVEFGRGSLIAKARQQPDKVRQVLEKVGTDGFASTLEAVRSKLDQPVPLGYCNVGRVLEAGAGTDGFSVGDRVVSNGRHAEVVLVPKHLCARIPDDVPDEAAAFTVLGAIALQGVRLVQPTLGETVVVVGLGLIGLLTVQVLAANGCRVMGVDMDPSRLELARRFGAHCVDLSSGQDPVAAGIAYSRGRGVDAVLITASTQSSAPVAQAAQMCRKRGRIVLVGVTGLELARADFYEKELTFQVSCSYGPGRYDPAYEEGGHDYPVAFVRWTEQRNFEAVLDLMASGALDVRPFISHRFPIADAARAYDLLASDEPSLGILIDYPQDESRPAGLGKRTIALPGLQTRSHLRRRPAPVVGVIGAGNYASRALIPGLKRAGAELHTLVSAGGVSATHHGGRQGFRYASTDPDAILGSTEIDAIVVATRHDSHARYVCKALTAGKHVFVEKPLAITTEEVDAIEACLADRTVGEQSGPILMVGFNRRFAPQVRTIQRLLGGVAGPKAMVMTVNAGAIPASHWTQDPDVGGGRIVGEACHFIDLLRHLAGSPIVRHHVASLRTAGLPDDCASISLTFADGSIGTVHYLSNGHRSLPKERLEVFAGGRVLQLDNFRRLRGYGWPRFSRQNLWRQDKGQAEGARAFVEAVGRGGPAPIPVGELLEVARVSIDVAQSMRA